MIDGILLINKEVGITSYDVIRRLKGVLPKGQKVGHAGTLDPFANGLLILLLGKSTKLFEKILYLEKEYIVKAEFGYSTNTQDVTGKKINILETEKKMPSKDIESIISDNFLGYISQVPPQFSAKKVNGKKAYEYARKGESVKLVPRDIEVKNFELIKYDWPFITFNIVCSSGTYVRTLIHDLGEKSKIWATAVELSRTRIGDFTLEEAANSEDINEGIELNLVSLANE
jgi:tRNA pseudouridine55 synthase